MTDGGSAKIADFGCGHFHNLCNYHFENAYIQERKFIYPKVLKEPSKNNKEGCLNALQESSFCF